MFIERQLKLIKELCPFPQDDDGEGEAVRIVKDTSQLCFGTDRLTGAIVLQSFVKLAKQKVDPLKLLNWWPTEKP